MSRRAPVAGTAGSSYDDTLIAASSGSDLYGSNGDDTLIGGAGSDALFGQNDDDTLEGGAGGDQLYGGSGTDTASYAGSSTAVTVDLLAGTAAGGDAEGDVLNSIENLAGSNLADTLTGDSAANVLYGNGGNDILFGNAGDDILNGGAGADELNGHYGNDTADYSGSASAITVDLSTGSASGGDAAGDTFINIENITGSDHDDSITGQSGANVLSGGAGADTIAAHSGDDELYGGAGNDVLNAHGGADILSGGTGDDTLNGGDGGDTYLFGRDDGSDTLLELANDSGTDVLSLGADIDETQIWFRQTGLDLEVSLIGTPDKVLVDGWFDSSAQQVEEFHTLDGDVLLNSQVQNLVNAMSGFSPPSAGQTQLPASYEDDLLPVMAANWSSSA